MQTKNRGIQIAEILDELNDFKKSTTDDHILYAIEQNIRFFKSAKSIFSFIYWLVSVASKIDDKKILEINDLLPKYDESMHTKLIEMERRQKPGLIKPAFDRIVAFIEKSNSDLILASFGSGGMELERQIVSHLLKKGYSKKILFIAVDQSDLAHKISKNNHSELGDSIESYDIDNCVAEDLERVRKNQKKSFAFIHCKNDIFAMLQAFPSKVFDLSYHTHFKHHLTDFQKEKLDEIVNNLSKNVIEYDGFLNRIGMIPQTIIGWSNPVFLNAEIISNLRYSKKTDIFETIKNKYPKSYVAFSNIGFYVLEYVT